VHAAKRHDVTELVDLARLCGTSLGRTRVATAAATATATVRRRAALL